MTAPALILACGSRAVDPFACFDWWIDRLSRVPVGSTVISGGARGTDTYALQQLMQHVLSATKGAA